MCRVVMVSSHRIDMDNLVHMGSSHHHRAISHHRHLAIDLLLMVSPLTVVLLANRLLCLIYTSYFLQNAALISQKSAFCDIFVSFLA